MRESDLPIKPSTLPMTGCSHPVYHTVCGGLVAFVYTANSTAREVIGDDGQFRMQQDDGTIVEKDVPSIPCQHCGQLLGNGTLTTEGELPR